MPQNSKRARLVTEEDAAGELVTVLFPPSLENPLVAHLSAHLHARALRALRRVSRGTRDAVAALWKARARAARRALCGRYGYDEEQVDAGARGVDAAMMKALHDVAGPHREPRLEEARLLLALPEAIASTLTMSGPIGDAGARVLAAALRHSTVRSVALHHCPINIDGVSSIAGALRLSSLQNLSLKDLGLWDAHARVIASGLRGSSVTKLDLSENMISDAGAHALAARLRVTLVTHLDLRHNRISNVGDRALAGVLGDSNVTHLNLRRLRLVH